MKTFALPALLLFAVPMFGQSCDTTVQDNAHLLGSSNASVESAAQKLINLGADPRVILDDSTSLTPEGYLIAMQNRCPSWNSASNGVKNNMVVFLVFPTRHKSAVFTGPEYAKALKTDVIRSQFMNPAFRDKDWARGLVSGIAQTATQIEAFQQAPLHPAAVVQQATDMHGLWVVMGWIVGLGALGGLIWLLFYLMGRWSGEHDAQQKAVAARNDAASQLQTTREWLETKEALHVDVGLQRNRYDAAAQDFSRVSQSVIYDPDTNGLSVQQYENIAERYNDIANSFRQFQSLPAAVPVPKPSSSYPATPGPYPFHRDRTRRVPRYSEPEPSSTIYAPVTIIDTGSTYIPPQQSYTPPSYTPPDTGWAGSSSDIGSSDSGGGDSGSFDGGGSSGGSSGDF